MVFIPENLLTVLKRTISQLPNLHSFPSRLCRIIIVLAVNGNIIFPTEVEYSYSILKIL